MLFPELVYVFAVAGTSGLLGHAEVPGPLSLLHGVVVLAASVLVPLAAVVLPGWVSAAAVAIVVLAVSVRETLALASAGLPRLAGPPGRRAGRP